MKAKVWHEIAELTGLSPQAAGSSRAELVALRCMELAVADSSTFAVVVGRLRLVRAAGRRLRAVAVWRMVLAQGMFPSTAVSELRNMT